MGVKNTIIRAAEKAGDTVAELSRLSPVQIEEVFLARENYLGEMAKEDPTSEDNLELAARLLAANSVEVFNSYLPQLKDLYVPVDNQYEYGKATAEDSDQTGLFNPDHNIRFFEISKWVIDSKENSLEKLVNVYEVLSNEVCNIALVFRRKPNKVEAYIAVSNTRNADDNNDANDFAKRLADALKGNFPGSELGMAKAGRIPFLDNKRKYSVACATNVPSEKSEKFISQTVEKLLDGIVPEGSDDEYTLILLATPILDIENRKLHLADYYSGLAPYAQWQTNYTYTESDSIASMATFGVNVGASAGIQNGQTRADTIAKGETDSNVRTETESQSEAETNSSTHTDTRNITHSMAKGLSHAENKSAATQESSGESFGGGIGAQIGIPKIPLSVSVQGNGQLSFTVSTTETEGIADTVSKMKTDASSRGTSDAVSNALSKSTGRAIAQSLGRAVSNSVSKTAGVFSSTSLGLNVGANFARSSTTNVVIGKNEGISQSFINFNVKHALDLLEQQMKRMEESAALGMWEFAAYVLSEDSNMANNVAHTYLALTQGDTSYMSHAAVNLWRGDIARVDEGLRAKEICSYLRDLRHPIFGLNRVFTKQEPYYNVYPPAVTATTDLTGRELAYALNFPQRSLPGLPVITCAEFGRSVVTYEPIDKSEARINLGAIFHMHRPEKKVRVKLSKKSLASHTFVTGSTGSGKSNTVCQILSEAAKIGVGFLVIEPAKGEYKDILGNEDGVHVYGTNPAFTPLLQINPFSFPEGIHVLEHLDRLVEIFNVCWPMYAAMPAVLKNAIERAYADCGWDLESSINRFGEELWPTFSDVARNVRIAINESEYDAENKGAYKGSLLTRLESLTNGINGMVFSIVDTPAIDLFDGKAIVDLSRVGSSETKSLIMGMIVLKLQEHRMTENLIPNSELRHLTVLEEAHNLLRRTSVEQPVEGGNLLGKSVEMVSNSIAEMRTYGEGFVIADQAPGLLDMAAIRNTNTKIIMRLPDLTDRELVGRAANLDDDQIAEISKLPLGVAAVYQNEWIQPVLCKVAKFDKASRKYAYTAPENVEMPRESSYSVYLAKLISSGAKLDWETLLKDVRPRMRGMGIDASMQVKIMKFLSNPPVEPRMTKLAPVMAALFPSARDALKDAYVDTDDPKKWTAAVEHSLRASIFGKIEDIVRRDIVQGLITDYVMNELGKVDDLKRWSAEGGLK